MEVLCIRVYLAGTFSFDIWNFYYVLKKKYICRLTDVYTLFQSMQRRFSYEKALTVSFKSIEDLCLFEIADWRRRSESNMCVLFSKETRRVLRYLPNFVLLFLHFAYLRIENVCGQWSDLIKTSRW